MEKEIKYVIDVKKLNKTFVDKKKEKVLALINVNLQRYDLIL